MKQSISRRRKVIKSPLEQRPRLSFYLDKLLGISVRIVLQLEVYCPHARKHTKNKRKPPTFVTPFQLLDDVPWQQQQQQGQQLFWLSYTGFHCWLIPFPRKYNLRKRPPSRHAKYG